MNRSKWPKVSFILLTLNGGEGVTKALQTIIDQDYPKHLIDIVVVDNGSSDDSVKIAKAFGARLFIEPAGTLYSNWIRGLHEIKGDFVFNIEQDIELRGKKFIKKMIDPMLLDARLSGTFTKEYPRSDMHWVCRFLSYHVCQCDPLYEFITPKIEETFIENHKNYIVSKFELGRVPPIGRMFYRIEHLKKTPNWDAKNYFDHDFVIQCIKHNFNHFAYVHDAGYFHFHAKNLMHLLKKRVRNLRMHFFPYRDETEYKWLNTNRKNEVFRMFFWVLYANLFLPEMVRGILRYFRHKDWALLMQPIVSIAVTDVLLWSFLTDKTGRRIILESVKTAFGIAPTKTP